MAHDDGDSEDLEAFEVRAAMRAIDLKLTEDPGDADEHEADEQGQAEAVGGEDGGEDGGGDGGGEGEGVEDGTTEDDGGEAAGGARGRGDAEKEVETLLTRRWAPDRPNCPQACDLHALRDSTAPLFSAVPQLQKVVS
eukprot:3798311-Pleurochrysis_carterae.AAC.3